MKTLSGKGKKRSAGVWLWGGGGGGGCIMQRSEQEAKVQGWMDGKSGKEGRKEGRPRFWVSGRGEDSDGNPL